MVESHIITPMCEKIKIIYNLGIIPNCILLLHDVITEKLNTHPESCLKYLFNNCEFCIINVLYFYIFIINNLLALQYLIVIFF